MASNLALDDSLLEMALKISGYSDHVHDVNLGVDSTCSSKV